MEIINSNILSKYNIDIFRNYIKQLEKESVDEMHYENFVQRHLTMFFKALHIKTPNISYNVSFNAEIQKIIISCNHLTWTVYNESNDILYYATNDTFTTMPVLISSWIFMDIINNMEYQINGKIVNTSEI